MSSERETTMSMVFLFIDELRAASRALHTYAADARRLAAIKDPSDADEKSHAVLANDALNLSLNALFHCNTSDDPIIVLAREDLERRLRR